MWKDAVCGTRDVPAPALDERTMEDHENGREVPRTPKNLGTEDRDGMQFAPSQLVTVHITNG